MCHGVSAPGVPLHIYVSSSSYGMHVSSSSYDMHVSSSSYDMHVSSSSYGMHASSSIQVSACSGPAHHLHLYAAVSAGPGMYPPPHMEFFFGFRGGEP